MSIQVPCYGVFVVIIFFKKCIIKQLLDNFGFCDIHNNEGLGKCYQPRPSTRLITLTSALIILDITET